MGCRRVRGRSCWRWPSPSSSTRSFASRGIWHAADSPSVAVNRPHAPVPSLPLRSPCRIERAGQEVDRWHRRRRDPRSRPGSRPAASWRSAGACRPRPARTSRRRSPTAACAPSKLTLNEPEADALRAIEAVARGGADLGLEIGAGTVLSIEAARRAIDAGATFLVMPHLDAEIVEWAAMFGIPAFPGCATPTEVLAAWRAGAAAVKALPGVVARAGLRPRAARAVPRHPAAADRWRDPRDGPRVHRGRRGRRRDGWLAARRRRSGRRPGARRRRSSARSRRPDSARPLDDRGRHARGVPHRVRGDHAGAARRSDHLRALRRRRRGERGGRARPARARRPRTSAGSAATGSATRSRRRLRGEGVDTTHLSVDPDAPTGLMFRERRGLGPAQVVYAGAARRARGSRPPTSSARPTAGVFRRRALAPRHGHHAGPLRRTHGPRPSAPIELARDAGLTISLDLNLRRRLWSDEAAAPVLRGARGAGGRRPRQPGRAGGRRPADRR